MLFTRNQILRTSEYWFEDAQNELYAQVVMYMEKEELNQTQLAKRLKVSKGYISQILKGEFNYTLKKLIEISLAIGQVPRIKYVSIAKVIEEDNKPAKSIRNTVSGRNKNKNRRSSPRSSINKY